MPFNRNTLLRYKTIDRMLRHGRRATLDELIDSCSDALYEVNGYGEVSRRTIQHDIQEMRYSQALGYYAPIKVVDKKYYVYEDYGYTITQVPLSAYDLSQLSEAVAMLKQMTAFSGFVGVEDVVNRLEDHVASMRFNVEPVIMLENNERMRGLEHITPIHDAIIVRKPVLLSYKSFASPEPKQFVFSPHILKEFRNRWFVFGIRHDLPDYPLHNLALDRIERISETPSGEKYQQAPDFHPHTYFNHIIGVTRVPDSTKETIRFLASESQAPYIRTKPLHQSQKELRTLDSGQVLFSIEVIPNHELFRDILAYGDGITVVEPTHIASQLKEILAKALAHYEASQSPRNREKQG